MSLTQPPELRALPTDAAGRADGGVEAPAEVAPVDLDTPIDAADAPTEVAGNQPIAEGQPCSHGGQCASTFCVDRVCCASECAARCHSCRVPGREGTCVPAAAGEDPRNDCTELPADTCMDDGTCDGAGGCRRRIAGSQCAPGSCTGATLNEASTCDGAGVCRLGSTRSCAPGVCQSGSCGESCTGDTQCSTGFHCANGACRPTLGQGSPCGRASACTSGHCVDGVCCNTACGSACHACNLTASPGTCAPVVAGDDPGNECAATDPSTCGTTGQCDGQGACQLHPAGTTCGAGASCSNDSETSARTCNGLGVCLSATTRSCSPYRCGATACASTCAGATQCQTGFVCSANACVPGSGGDGGVSGGELLVDDFADGDLRSNSLGGQVTWNNATVTLVAGEQKLVWNGTGTAHNLIETFRADWCERDLSAYTKLRFRMRSSVTNKRVAVYLGIGTGACAASYAERVSTVTLGTTMTTYEIDLASTERTKLRTLDFSPNAADATEYVLDDIVLAR